MTKRNSSIGILDLLTLLFIGLKLAGKIDWSWWWVFSPIWIAFLVFLAIGLLAKAIDNYNMKDPNYRARKAAEATMREIIEKSEERRRMFE